MNNCSHSVVADVTVLAELQQLHPSRSTEHPIMFAFCHNQARRLIPQLPYIDSDDSSDSDSEDSDSDSEDEEVVAATNPSLFMRAKKEEILAQWDVFRRVLVKSQARRKGRAWRLANIYNPHTRVGDAWLRAGFNRV